MYMRIRMTAVALLIGLTAALGGCGRPPAPAAGAASTGTKRILCAVRRPHHHWAGTLREANHRRPAANGRAAGYGRLRHKPFANGGGQ